MSVILRRLERPRRGRIGIAEAFVATHDEAIRLPLQPIQCLLDAKRIVRRAGGDSGIGACLPAGVDAKDKRWWMSHRFSFQSKVYASVPTIFAGSNSSRRLRLRLAPIVATGNFPNLAQFVKEASGESSGEDFEFGLECALDGLADSVPALAQSHDADGSWGQSSPPRRSKNP